MENSGCFPLVKLESNTVCHGCLSSGRVLRPVKDTDQKIFSLLSQQQRSPENEKAIILFCWECIANLRSIKKFQNRIQNAQWLLQQSHYAMEQYTSSLSTLSIVILNNEITLKHEEITNTLDDNKEIANTLDDNKVITNTLDNNKVVIEEPSVKDGVYEKIKEENIESDNLTENELSRCSTDAELHEGTDVKDIPIKKKKQKTRILEYAKRAKVSKNPEIDLIKPENNYSIIYLNAQEMEDFVKKDNKGMKPKKKSRYHCKICSYTYKSLKDLNRHKTFQHAEPSHSGTYSCLECHEVHGTQGELQTHWDRHNYVLECRVCGVRKRQRPAMMRHITCHLNLYTCVDCHMRFSSRADFNRHYLDLHKLLICDYCGRRATNKTTLLNHMKCKTHIRRRNHLPATCVECHKFFTRYESLRAHIHSVHPHLVGKNADPSLSYCVECDKQYTTVDKYKQHISRSHTPKEKVSIPCPECGKVFSRKTHMNNHYRLFHGGNSKHYCSSCDKHYATAFTLVKHRRAVHEKFRLPNNKICDICKRGFSTNRTLTNHRRTHTGERPHQCPHCAAAFAQITALKTHIRTQHKHDINS